MHPAPLELAAEPAPPPVVVLPAAWSIDAANGCKVWNARPRENETVTWSGACRDG